MAASSGTDCIILYHLMATEAPESNRNGIVSVFVISANIISLSKESIPYYAETGDLQPKC